MNAPVSGLRCPVGQASTAAGGILPPEPSPALPSPGVAARPTIIIRAGEIEPQVNAAEKALVAASRGVYQRDGRVVTVCETPIPAADGRVVSGLRIVECPEAALTEHLTAAAQWVKPARRPDKGVPADAPAKVVKALLARGQWRLPVLRAVIGAPTLRHDGTILHRPGYDDATCLLFEPRGGQFPAIPEHPTRTDAGAALERLRALVRTFPFKGPPDEAVAVSALMTAVLRWALPNAPMHGFTAPVPGSGKTMLVDLAAILATGKPAGVIAQGPDETEMEKRLSAVLLSGDPVLAIDNCERPLSGQFLCQVFTSETVKPRVLGKSKAPEISTCAFVCATGNNLTMEGDMTRRALLCSLDPQTERPELRTFGSDPRAEAMAHRGELVAAVLTIARAYWAAGRPNRPTPIGSFEAWSDMVRGPLIWLGMADPADTMETARAADPQLQARETVVGQWREVFGERRVTVSAAIAEANKTDVPGAYDAAPEYRYPAFREVLMEVAGDRNTISSKRFGKWLAANAGRVVNGLRILQAGVMSGLKTWQVLPV